MPRAFLNREWSEVITSAGGSPAHSGGGYTPPVGLEKLAGLIPAFEIKSLLARQVWFGVQNLQTRRGINMGKHKLF